MAQDCLDTESDRPLETAGNLDWADSVNLNLWDEEQRTALHECLIFAQQ